MLDAGGLGMLVFLHNWAFANCIQLKLVNASERVRQMFELTRLTPFCISRRSRTSYRSSVAGIEPSKMRLVLSHNSIFDGPLFSGPTLAKPDCESIVCA